MVSVEEPVDPLPPPPLSLPPPQPPPSSARDANAAPERARTLLMCTMGRPCCAAGDAASPVRDGTHQRSSWRSRRASGVIPDVEWTKLELRYLQALRAVAREGSFGRAALDLGYTQSAISQQIAALERIAGEQLVRRPKGRSPVALTDAGRVMLRHADAIVAQAQAARADLEALGRAGTVRVGSFQSPSAHLVPGAVSMLAERVPEAQVELHEAQGDAELLHLVEVGELDMTFC